HSRRPVDSGPVDDCSHALPASVMLGPWTTTTTCTPRPTRCSGRVGWSAVRAPCGPCGTATGHDRWRTHQKASRTGEADLRAVSRGVGWCVVSARGGALLLGDIEAHRAAAVSDRGVRQDGPGGRVDCGLFTIE